MLTSAPTHRSAAIYFILSIYISPVSFRLLDSAVFPPSTVQDELRREGLVASPDNELDDADMKEKASGMV